MTDRRLAIRGEAVSDEGRMIVVRRRVFLPEPTTMPPVDETYHHDQRGEGRHEPTEQTEKKVGYHREGLSCLPAR